MVYRYREGCDNIVAKGKEEKMNDRLLESYVRPDGQQRVIIVQRPDGRYSFRKQSISEETGEWGPAGPHIGFYDSAETAKWEAMGKVDWLGLP